MSEKATIEMIQRHANEGYWYAKDCIEIIRALQQRIAEQGEWIRMAKDVMRQAIYYLRFGKDGDITESEVHKLLDSKEGGEVK